MKTRDGDTDIFIISNLSKSKASAKKIAVLYRGRWSIETAFQDLAEHLNSEINTLMATQSTPLVATCFSPTPCVS